MHMATAPNAHSSCPPPLIRSSIRRGIAAAIVVCAFFGVGSVHASDSLINHRAPVFSLLGLDHTRINLAHYRGKVVLLNFWATWCAPCRIEMPRFAEWQNRYGLQGFQVIAISIDDDDPPVRAFVRKLHLNYPVAMGTAHLGERYGGVLGVPVTFLIDRNGIVRSRFDGESDLHAVEAEVLKLLERKEP